jgi:ABC-type Fe3+/spermidine/putrescine transport system ATPase subunit
MASDHRPPGRTASAWTLWLWKTLRSSAIVAGLEVATAGELLVNGDRYNETPANHRDMGMVFQSYSLFPNLTVSENIDYGLQCARVDSDKP